MPRVHPLTLSFADLALERVYRRERAEVSRSAWRRNYRNVAIAWLLFCVWDYVVLPDVAATLWIMRATIAAPLAVLCALFGYVDVDRFSRWSQLVGAASFGIPASIAVFLPFWVPELALHVGYVVIAMQAFAHSAMSLRFIYATSVSIGILIAYVASVMLAPPPPEVSVFSVLAWGSLAACIGMLASRSFELFRRRDFWKKRQLQEERARSEKLLLNVLPPSIAERLKRGEQPIAERFNEVTVLFADIAQFTPLAERSTPERVVEILNEIFSIFDRITAEHGLEKIKTIGDAYMVAGGAPARRDDHVHAVANLALALREAVRTLAVGELSGLAVRIGIHSGPVVAGVIGQRKFTWDLWGDTVNTASRMESHGRAGEIQVSAVVAERLAADFRLENRGDIDVKGKGRMPAWILLDRSTGAVATRG